MLVYSVCTADVSPAARAAQHNVEINGGKSNESSAVGRWRRWEGLPQAANVPLVYTHTPTYATPDHHMQAWPTVEMHIHVLTLLRPEAFRPLPGS